MCLILQIDLNKIEFVLRTHGVWQIIHEFRTQHI